MTTARIHTGCCIAGGGPAGIMLGFLLARMGIDVWILEKHADFLRDFRGDTIHPSTLEIMYELGLLDEFLRRPHQELREIGAQVGGDFAIVGDFTHLPTHCKFIAFMPQWEFLNFLAEQGRGYRGFHLEMEAEVTDLIERDGEIKGVRAKTRGGELEVHADLTVAADGRKSVVRERAGLKRIVLGAPMDILWLRMSRKLTDPGQTLGHIEAGRALILLNRDDYWQMAFVIPKDTADQLREKGMPQFREQILHLAPFLSDRIDELQDWEQVKLLTVAVDRLSRWSRPGLLCIGDAAHAMSPVGGVGINLAIQDAVATANILGRTLVYGMPAPDELDEVQRRRSFPTRATQWLQIVIQNRVIKRVLSSTEPLSLPWPLKLAQRFPVLRRIPARVIGIGFRPEHVNTVAARVAVDSSIAAD